MTLFAARTPALRSLFSPRLRHLALCACLVLAAGLAGAPHQAARADDEDHERARHALETDRIRPLAEILAKVRASLPGRIIGTEFEEERGRYVYEFKVISPSGQVREVYVDATSGVILAEEED